ncbi:MAG: homoserine dehydrogenase [Gammaproteobacteria bacterium]|nr:homoserine dehydrogenase [Gammaproteobacteria bacterium]
MTTASTDPINIGLVGLGTVGAGTVNVLRRNQVEISRRAGREIRIRSAAVRDLKVPRDCVVDDLTLTSNPFDVTDDPEISLVVELVGGCHIAKEVVLRSLQQGKHVVTANKALIALHGNDIFQAAHERGLMVAFEAAVAGGISIIKVIREGLSGNRIDRIVGIINGTSNYILTLMLEEQYSFESALQEAQRKGFAETDPSFDVDGIDAGHKLAILAAIGFGIPLQFDRVHVEGISNVTLDDIQYAAELGYRIKHLGIAQRTPAGAELRTHACLTPVNALLANVSGEMNAILIEGDAVGPTLHYGAGAGAEPTASSVVADIVDVVRALTTDPGNRVPHLAFQPSALTELPLVPILEVDSANYLRLQVIDQPGVLADITRILGEMEISIEAIVQKGASQDGEAVPVIITTHRTLEQQIVDASMRIEALETVVAPITRIRIYPDGA